MFQVNTDDISPKSDTTKSSAPWGMQKSHLSLKAFKIFSRSDAIKK